MVIIYLLLLEVVGQFLHHQMELHGLLELPEQLKNF